jgi:hypothetical protein
MDSNWNGPQCPRSSESDDSSIHAELGRLLNILNCLPGNGYLKIVVDQVQVTVYELPFTASFVPLPIRKDLLLAMTGGGGCEVRLTIPEASHTLLFAICVQSGKWQGCPSQDVRQTIMNDAQEIAVEFPSTGSVERLRPFAKCATT